MNRRSLKPCSRHSGKHRVSPPPMQKRHRSRQDLTTTGWKPAALNKIIAFSQFFGETRNLEKIIAIIGISHYYESATSSRYSAHESVSVTFRLDVNDACAESLRYFRRS